MIYVSPFKKLGKHIVHTMLGIFAVGLFLTFIGSIVGFIVIGTGWLGNHLSNPIPLSVRPLIANTVLYLIYGVIAIFMLWLFIPMLRDAGEAFANSFQWRKKKIK